MKNIARISKDYHSQLSNDIWNEDLNEYIQSLDVYIRPRNNNFSYDALKNQTRSIFDFYYTNKCIVVEAKGYVQSEWESFSVYYKCRDKEVNPLIEHLKKTFTHRNDYLIENVEELITGHTKVVDRCVVIEEMQDGVKVYDEYKLIE